VLLSGGLDSAAALYLSAASETRATFVDYGQVTARAEERAARALCSARGVPLEVVQVTDLARLGAGTLVNARRSPLADGAFEEQEDEWFPGRNLMLVAIGTIALATGGGGELAFGAFSESYRDARPEFFHSAQAAIAESLPRSIKIVVTVPTESRLDVLRAACEDGLEPRLTFSCNRRADRHCWRCTSCRDRSTLLQEVTPGDAERGPGQS
jgi:7-cyano-7-deazaguanine synthase